MWGRRDLIAEAASLLAGASSALFITGAGLSADSGLPTYRGVGGLYDGPAAHGLSIEVALSGAMLEQDPAITWHHIHEIEAACRGASPNPGHRALAELESLIPRAWVLTQNVDGFHRAAGSRNVIEIHGDLHDLACVSCPWRDRVVDYRSLGAVPTCSDCDAIVRPEVVLFGERLDRRKVLLLEDQLRAGFDVVVSVGTTSTFPYIAGPVLDAARRGVPTIEINPGESEVSAHVDLAIRAGAARSLQRILDRVRKIR